ncbi:hypothetical protein B7494_g2668 [Chlorociboria aeruginascens]|nr:hypothetical protein B7494_g2668 [Chlorociboria aeruginascens]
MADEDEFGDISDEDFIEACSSQASQTLPSHTTKRRRASIDDTSDERGRRPPRRRRTTEGEESGDEDERKNAKKKKYKVFIGGQEHEVPEAVIVGATQADGMPDSSPTQIRGPIYRKHRPGPPTPTEEVERRHMESVVVRRVETVTPQNGNRQPRPLQMQNSRPSEDIARELEDLPSDAFSSSPESGFTSRRPIVIGSHESSLGSQQPSLSRQRPVAPQVGLRQTTLFGGRAPDEVAESQVRPSQAKKVHNYLVDKTPEPPTHHALDQEALKTWVYPTNLGAIRDYQFSIVRHGLFNNLLVALPTGLGKTFIAATIMLNFYRWTKDAQIIFVAPTKPLVAQQVSACFNIVGIPRSTTTMLTGEQVPALHNDLRTGIADPKKIVLLVVDEAHRATGNYSYVKVVQFIRRFNKSFRVLALTATPGSSVESVQEVIDGLEIAKVEIRTEESIDIQQYVHQRTIQQILLDPSDEIIQVREALTKALQSSVNTLCRQNAYYNRDPMSLNPYAMHQARAAWVKSDAGRKSSMGVKGMVQSLFSVLGSISMSIKLLNFHGIAPAYSKLKEFQESTEGGNKGGKYKNDIVKHPEFVNLMGRLRFLVSKEDFIGHPKLVYLKDTVLNHFLDAGEGRLGNDAPPSSTRVIVFSEYRESAEGICRVLNQHQPMIRASVFVGQADSKNSAGMNQAKQQETIANFKAGVFNVIVATSIGEEGLDIGQVDLIVCYDASGSPIRMLQRMGRTGRKRAGKVVMLLMRGKEADQFSKAKDNYEQMQQMISNGDRFSFKHDLSARIVPKDIKPVVDKRLIDIPPENTQDCTLPEPKRRVSRMAKKPAKKFHMPDGVETGFRKASKLSKEGGDLRDLGVTIKPKKAETEELLPIPSLNSVLLNPEQLDKLERTYQIVPGVDHEEVSMPDLTAQTITQRSLTPTIKIEHGQYTKRCVRLFQTLAKSQAPEDRYFKPYGDMEPDPIQWISPGLFEDESEMTPQPKKPAPAKRKPSVPKDLAISISDEGSEGGSDHPQLLNSKRTRRQAPKHVPMDSDEGEGDVIGYSSERSVEDSDEASLNDFVVNGTDEQDQTQTQSSMPSLPTPELKSCKPVRFTATQNSDSEDEMPTVEDLVRTSTNSKSRPQLTNGMDGVNESSPIIAGRGRRKVIEEDSDE